MEVNLESWNVLKLENIAAPKQFLMMATLSRPFNILIIMTTNLRQVLSKNHEVILEINEVTLGEINLTCCTMVADKRV